VRSNSERMHSMETLQLSSDEKFTSLLGESVREIRKTSESLPEQLGASLNRVAATSFEAFRSHVSQVLSGEDGVSRSLNVLDSRMTAWETKANTDLVKYREMADKLQVQVGQLEDAVETARKRQASAEEACHKTTDSFNAKVQALEGDITERQRSLEKALDHSLANSMRKLKELDARGLVKLNRQTGVARLSTPIEFTPCPPKEKPAPEFKDPITADKVIRDAVELIGIFDQPLDLEVVVKPGKGGNAAFWEEVAQAQAEILRSRLDGGGPQLGRVRATGRATAKGVPGVVLKLASELFPEQADEKAPSRSASRGPSPPRRGR